MLYNVGGGGRKGKIVDTELGTHENPNECFFVFFFNGICKHSLKCVEKCYIRSRT